MTAKKFTPAEAESYLRSLELFGMRFGLDRMQRLTTALDYPQKRFASIHVVGTNGKTSTAYMIAAILAEHGLRTGTYCSPDLTGFNERIRIGGRSLPPSRFAAAVGRAARAAELVNRTTESGDVVTQFEALTAAAYSELAGGRVEVAVIEAGLGGRFDATNVIDSSVQVLTTVGLEHTRWLGPTEANVAGEKLAVVPEGGWLVCGPLGAEALRMAQSVAADRQAKIALAGRDFSWREGGHGLTVIAEDTYDGIEMRALGRFQKQNFACAVKAAEAFLGRLDEGVMCGVAGRVTAPGSLDKRTVRDAAAGVAIPGRLDKRTVRDAAARVAIPGRLQVIGRDPPIVIDGAHNKSGMAELAASLADVVGSRPLVACVSILDDKDAAQMLEVLLPLCRGVVFTRSRNPRSYPPATLARLCEQLGGPTSEVEPDCDAALSRALSLAGEEGAVLVTGSIYLLADLLKSGKSLRVAQPVKCKGT